MSAEVLLTSQVGEKGREVLPVGKDGEILHGGQATSRISKLNVRPARGAHMLLSTLAVQMETQIGGEYSLITAVDVLGSGKEILTQGGPEGRTF